MPTRRKKGRVETALHAIKDAAAALRRNLKRVFASIAKPAVEVKPMRNGEVAGDRSPH